MSRIIFIFCLIIISTTCFAQQAVLHLDTLIPMPIAPSTGADQEISLRNNVLLWCNEDKLWFIRCQKVEPSQAQISFSSYSLADHSWSFMEDTLLMGSTQVREFYSDGRHILVNVSHKLYHIAGGRVKNLSDLGSDVNFAHVEPLTDSSILLWRVYDHHPNDGSSGLTLSTYHLNKQMVTQTKLYSFPATLMGYALMEWVATNKGVIYAINPLTAEQYRFTTALSPIDTIQLSLFDGDELKRNKDFLFYIDSLRKKAHSKNVEASFLQDFYQKDMIVKLTDSLRRHYRYIEKYWIEHENKAWFTMSSPGYGLKKRDLYHYQLRESTKPVCLMKSLSFTPPDTITHLAQRLLTFLNLSYDRLYRPVIKGNKWYRQTPITDFFLRTGPRHFITEDEEYEYIKKQTESKWRLAQFSY